MDMPVEETSEKDKKKFEEIAKDIEPMKEKHVEKLTDLFVRLVVAPTEHINSFDDIDFSDIEGTLKKQEVWDADQFKFRQTVIDLDIFKRGYLYKYTDLMGKSPREIPDWVRENEYMFKRPNPDYVINGLRDDGWRFMDGLWRKKEVWTFEDNYRALVNDIRDRIPEEVKGPLSITDYPKRATSGENITIEAEVSNPTDVLNSYELDLVDRDTDETVETTAPFALMPTLRP